MRSNHQFLGAVKKLTDDINKNTSAISSANINIVKNTGNIVGLQAESLNSLALNLHTLYRWKASLAKLQSGKKEIFNLNIVGDSISEGGNAGNPSQYPINGYVGKIRTELNNKFGNTGFGFISTFHPNGAPLMNFSSGWATISNSFGPTGRHKESTKSGDIATVSFDGNAIDVFVAKTSLGGTFTVKIDNGSEQVFDTYSNIDVSVHAFSISNLTEGTHTLTITSTVTTGKTVKILGVCPYKGSAGIRVNNMSRWGTSSYDHKGENTLSMEIDFWNPTLTIIALGVNDYENQADIQWSFKTNLQPIIERAKQYGDVLLVAQGPRISEGKTIPQIDYVNAIRDLAKINKVAYLDIYRRWNGDNTNFAKDVLGFVDDTVHPSIAGHQDIANAILRILLG